MLGLSIISQDCKVSDWDAIKLHKCFCYKQFRSLTVAAPKKKKNEAIEEKNRHVVLWHFQFHDAIRKQPTHVGLHHDAGPCEMSLGFLKVMETRGWLRDAGQTQLWSPEGCGTGETVGAN